jgi:hypothetical protein
MGYTLAATVPSCSRRRKISRGISWDGYKPWKMRDRWAWKFKRKSMMYTGFANNFYNMQALLDYINTYIKFGEIE